jgi:predicted transposase YdaD
VLSLNLSTAKKKKKKSEEREIGRKEGRQEGRKEGIIYIMSYTLYILGILIFLTLCNAPFYPW